MRATQENILTYLSEIKEQLSYEGITTLALFGSFARNEQGVYSDIDIAIAKAPDYLEQHSAYSYFEHMDQLKTLIRQKFHRNSDIFDLDSNSPFKESITKELLHV